MGFQVFDDGSTLTWDDYGSSATPAPSNAYSINNSSGFPSGSDILGALSNGFGKWIDYKAYTSRPQNTTPVYDNTPAHAVNQGGIQISSGMVMLGLLAAGAFVLLKD